MGAIMPTIVFASSKGGAGKSTSAVVLATELALSGSSVIVIDADPNKPVSDWARKSDKTENLSVLTDTSEVERLNAQHEAEILASGTHADGWTATITDVIEDAAQRATFVIVDLEGTANMKVSYAISRADLVVIPVKGSFLDAKEAAKAVALVQAQERAFRLKIPFALLFTQTSAAIRPRTLKDVQSQVNNLGYPVFNVEIFERDIFRSIFSCGKTLYGLSETEDCNPRAKEAAIINARTFAGEVLKRLKGLSFDDEEQSEQKQVKVA